jgi:hypothetical protein
VPEDGGGGGIDAAVAGRQPLAAAPQRRDQSRLDRSRAMASRRNT